MDQFAPTGRLSIRPIRLPWGDHFSWLDRSDGTLTVHLPPFQCFRNPSTSWVLRLVTRRNTQRSFWGLLTMDLSELLVQPCTDCFNRYVSALQAKYMFWLKTFNFPIFPICMLMFWAHLRLPPFSFNICTHLVTELVSQLMLQNSTTWTFNFNNFYLCSTKYIFIQHAIFIFN